MFKHLTITVAGSPREGKNLELFEKHVLEKIRKIADEPKCERYNFAMINFRFIFTAMNFDITKIDTIHRQVLKLTGDYLTKWQYSINIKYIESYEE